MEKHINAKTIIVMILLKVNNINLLLNPDKSTNNPGDNKEV